MTPDPALFSSDEKKQIRIVHQATEYRGRLTLRIVSKRGQSHLFFAIDVEVGGGVTSTPLVQVPEHRFIRAIAVIQHLVKESGIVSKDEILKFFKERAPVLSLKEVPYLNPILARLKDAGVYINLDELLEVLRNNQVPANAPLVACIEQIAREYTNRTNTFPMTDKQETGIVTRATSKLLPSRKRR